MGNILRNNLGTWGIPWEYDIDTLGIRGKTKSPFPLRKKKPGPLILSFLTG
jgi:hypothetical protein